MVTRKLTEEQIKDIPIRYLSGESTFSIAKDYNIATASICNQLNKVGIARRSTKKQFCLNGHDRFVVGVYKNSSCKKCVADKTAVYDPIKMRSYKRKYKHNNKDAWRQSTKDWRLKNPKSASLSSRKSLLKKYGLTQESFEQLVFKQNSCCAICKKELTIGGKSGCAIDHCHKTGIVRGILCSPCNTGIGHLKDDVQILTNAINYLNKSRAH